MELLIIKMENYDSDFKFNAMEGEDGEDGYNEVLEEGGEEVLEPQEDQEEEVETASMQIPFKNNLINM